MPVSSESEAEDTYKTNARLSDVCATLRELEFGTLKKELNESYKNESPERKPLSCITKTYPTSPVFIIKPKKVVLPRKKDSLVTVIRSPESVYGSEFLSCKVTEKQNFCDKENNSETNCNSDQNSTIKQDESFLDLSFTEIDNMCKTLINSKNKTDSLIESEDLSDMVLLKNQKAINLDKFHSTSIVKKHFYISELSTEVEHTGKYFTSYDEIHNTKYKLLNRQVGQKIMKSHNNNIDNSFWSECNSFLIENNKKQLDFKVVRKSQEANIEICKKENKKVPFNKLDKCISEIDSSLHNKKVTHVAILEEEEKMLEAVEEAEKTLAEEAEMVKAANEMENTSIVNTNEGTF